MTADLLAEPELRLLRAVERHLEAGSDETRSRVLGASEHVLGRGGAGPDAMQLKTLLRKLFEGFNLTENELGELAYLELTILKNPPGPREQQDEPTGPVLEFVTLKDLIAEVRDAPPVSWLCRSVWPADAYGMLAAESKAGKTWAVLDLVVSVAASLPWLGQYDTVTSGPVLVFLGEGGKRKMLRRLDAVARAKHVELRTIAACGLVQLCFRVPHLSNELHLAEIKARVAEFHPALIVVDPLYLAARGAKGSDLYAMGEHLERIQLIAQEAGAALVVVHHWNQTGKGKDASRMSGAGPAEWGRVLCSVGVANREVDGAATVVDLDWTFTGDEIPDTTMKLRRRVWADDPDDLASPMHYEIEPIVAEPKTSTWDGPTQCMDAVLAFLQTHKGEEFSKSALPLSLRAAGHGFQEKTVRLAAETLAQRQQITHRHGPRNADLYSWPPQPALTTDTEEF